MTELPPAKDRPSRHWQSPLLLSHDLPTRPRPEVGRVLVTGASGYIGGRLVPELLARGYRVRVMVRASSPEYAQRWPGAEIAVADALDLEKLREALRDVRVAYYLIHSLSRGPKRFEATDIQAATNFRKAAVANGLDHVIYLGGLGDARGRLSDHLRSRMEVANALQAKAVRATVLRAAIIIGSGSASYEIIEHLVKRCPVILMPKLANNKCQPIAIRDVIKFLVGVLETPETAGKTFDIGGNEVFSYREMMEILADLLRKRRLFLTIPLSYTALYAYLTSLYTPVPGPIIRCLMEGLRNDVVCQDNAIRRYLPVQTISYREALVRAMSREEQDAVHTRWSDAYPPAHELALKLDELEETPRHTASYSLVTEKSADALFRSICRIGGKRGWFHSNWLWRLRGALDRLLMGVGASRGRRSHSELKINDVIDFWRVEDLRPSERLLLRAEMKLPGRAWLEFAIGRAGNGSRLSVRPYYETRTLWGKLYWYSVLPLHHFIFTRLLEHIERQS
ncbi:MAG TPA: SDR family oxidoreductase [Sumerlaeia bacterium]|nr:SDR family oxidoreductase [Sumerlaeia bacterium]